MSIFLPYSPIVVLEYFTTSFSLNLSTLTDYQTLLITLIANAYFFCYWAIIIYFSLKLFNRIYERIF